MARCELSGKGPVVKNLVSHSNIKTKSTAFINVQKKRVFSRILNRMVSLKMSTNVIKSLDHVGGLDAYLLRADDKQLSTRAKAVKDRFVGKISKAKSSKKAEGTKS